VFLHDRHPKTAHPRSQRGSRRRKKAQSPCERETGCR
jgi:hypothetical protein